MLSKVSTIGVVLACMTNAVQGGDVLNVAESKFLFGAKYQLGEQLLFLTWSRNLGKEYQVEELEQRFNIWQDSKKLVEEHNKNEANTYLLEMNEYADITHEEFKTLYGLNFMEGQDCSATKGQHKLSGVELPKSVDWRETGIVSPVKNQGHCGSCWTFSTTGALEAHHAKKTGQKILLSEQQLVDCAQRYNNNGCNGGLPSQAFEYIMYNGGLDRERDYPYKGANGDCHYDRSEVGATVSGVHNITQYNEEEIHDAVAHVGPVSIAFQVAPDFRLYKSGVYNSNSCGSKPTDVNHAVLAVGYDETADGKPYWIVKNSWGPKWGIDGYFHISRGTNECGVATCASYPLV